MNALVRETSILRLAVALFLLISASGCVTYYQPLHGHDGFYHEGRHGPDVIVVEHYPFSHYDPLWHPWWSVSWLYVDRQYLGRQHIAAPPALTPVHRNPPSQIVERRQAQGRIERPAVRRELPPPRSARRGSVGTISTAPRPTQTIPNRSPQRQAARPRPPRHQEP